ncbi:uncharacterized protein LOC124271852 [Haliotis rubra]|uniref:uncharacterized protein LOC124271852 n=1 Tax=Haliotis rubra TaxID=36100 RepID=UPI001EE52C59|nr:uncharacterized protein LOC124271852 [Haliotis rubra]
MAGYSPFKDYLGFSGLVFSEETKSNSCRGDPSKFEGKVSPVQVGAERTVVKSPSVVSDRPRKTSVSSVETDVSDDTCASRDSDSTYSFCLPNIPEFTRPILPQKQSRPVPTSPINSERFNPSPCLEVEDRNFIGTDYDREDVLSSAADLRSSLHRHDVSAAASTVTGMMEKLVMDAVERKMRDTAEKFNRPTVCVFCQRNGETIEYYSTHVLKDNRGKVICPVLRKYVCPKCSATGDNAHTVRHCPQSRTALSIADTFKTPRTSSGFRKTTF